MTTAKQDLKKFQNNGYITLKNFISKKDKIDIINVIYNSFYPHIKLTGKKKFSVESKEFSKKLLLLRKKNPKKFGDIYDKFRLNAKLRSIFYKKKFLNVFSKILNTETENIFLNGFMLRLDAPNDKRNALDWHQDSSYYLMSHPKYNAGVCWVAITKNSKKNGTLIFIPETNKFMEKTKDNKKNAFFSDQKKIKISNIELKNKKNLNQSFGDVSFLHMHLKHRSGFNSSQKFRITLACRFHDMSSSFNTGKEIYKYNKKIKV